jgi:hypothetical protein
MKPHIKKSRMDQKAHDNNISSEIQARLMAGNRCYALQNVLKSKTLFRKTKLNVYKTIIRPVVTYCS